MLTSVLLFLMLLGLVAIFRLVVVPSVLNSIDDKLRLRRQKKAAKLRAKANKLLQEHNEFLREKQLVSSKFEELGVETAKLEECKANPFEDLFAWDCRRTREWEIEQESSRLLPKLHKLNNKIERLERKIDKLLLKAGKLAPEPKLLPPKAEDQFDPWQRMALQERCERLRAELAKAESELAKLESHPDSQKILTFPKRL